MDRKQAAFFSIIAVAVLAGASISLNYVGMNTGVLVPRPTTGMSIPVVQNGSAIVNHNDTFRAVPDPNPPSLRDSGLKVEKLITNLAAPTSMAFVGNNDLLIVQKDNGRVRLVSNGVLQPKPIFDGHVQHNSERGLLGIAVSDSSSPTKSIFLYFTENVANDVRNRVYKYEWNGTGNLTGGTTILDLPGTPGPNHDGGKLRIGPDGTLYAVIGDLNRNGMLQNFKNGPPPDNTSVILRVDKDGNAVNGTNRYFAYGVRNSFGLTFDPLTKTLWDSENGPADYDEINVVKQGFNSGWEQVMGPIGRTGKSIDDLVQLEGSHYADPVFSWKEARGLTDIEFLHSTKLGETYANNIFVGDINNGNLYFFKVNKDRNGLEVDEPALQDLVADNNAESQAVTLGTGFGGITDIETGSDGYLYILAYNGNLFRIVPANN